MTPRSYPTVSRAELSGRISAAYRRYEQLATTVDGDTPIGDWTARAVTAHLVNVMNRYNDFGPHRLGAVPREVNEVNQRELETYAEASVDELLVPLAEEMRRFEARWGADSPIPLDTPIPFHGGATIDLECGLANALGEFIIHGRDLAVATNTPWPLDDRDAIHLCRFATQILPFYLRRPNPHTLQFHFDVDGAEPWAYALSDDVLESRAAVPNDEPDFVLSGPPSAFMLMLYGRADFAAAQDAGLWVSGGRRPELAPLIVELFESP